MLTIILVPSLRVWVDIWFESDLLGLMVVFVETYDAHDVLGRVTSTHV